MSLNHIHLLVRAELEKSPTKKDEKKTQKEISKIIKDIGMEVFFTPVAIYSSQEGNSGLSYIGMLTTSHISGHYYREPDETFMENKGHHLYHGDCYTCSTMWDKEVKVILTMLAQYNPKKVSVSIIDREHGLDIIASKASYDHKKLSYQEFLDSLTLKFSLSYRISKIIKKLF